MKSLFVPACLLALAAACAGCADLHSSDRGTATMGAGPANGTLCHDGAMLPANSDCANNGGVMGPPPIRGRH